MLHRFSPTTDSITDRLTADHTIHAGQTTQHNGPNYIQEVHHRNTTDQTTRNTTRISRGPRLRTRSYRIYYYDYYHYRGKEQPFYG